MKLWLADYTLTPKQNLNAASDLSPRHGFLLKVQWSPSRVGYSDVFPWPEFGDPTASQLQAELAERKISSNLLLASLKMNSLDATARKQRRSLFLGLTLPKSHALVSAAGELELRRFQGFDHFKIKMSDKANLQDFFSSLKSQEKLRLDFNGTLNFKQFTDFWSDLTPEQKQKIDLIEDPWNDEGEALDAPLAQDFLPNKNWPHRILKPARAPMMDQSVILSAAKDLLKHQPPSNHTQARTILTHSMDHSVGQAFALWSAAKWIKYHPTQKETHGVNPHHSYTDNDFHTKWMKDKQRLHPPPGFGIGFDDLFKDQKWQPL